jgi:methylated-DNA-[protein]-cysteine S-methyltransferase
VARGDVKLNQKEVVYHYISKLVGWLELKTSPRGVRSISFIRQPAKPETSCSDPVMKRLVKELDSYFAGNFTKFTVPVDPASGTTFQRQVWNKLTTIPYGETRAYSEVARAVGRPSAARAVGSANKRNDIPILIPCHRVIHADGTLGGYASGLKIKRALLKLEGAYTQ